MKLLVRGQFNAAELRPLHAIDAVVFRQRLIQKGVAGVEAKRIYPIDCNGRFVVGSPFPNVDIQIELRPIEKPQTLLRWLKVPAFDAAYRAARVATRNLSRRLLRLEARVATGI